MLLSKENLQQILEYLKYYGVKDTELSSIQSKELRDTDILSVVHALKNRSITLAELRKAILKQTVYKDGSIVVEDSLESSSTVNALSANQGKILNDKIKNLKPLVQSVSELTSLSTWQLDDGTYYHYKGMTVAVIDATALYMYIGTSYDTDAVRKSTNWVQCSGSNSGITQIANKDDINPDNIKPGQLIYVTSTDQILFVDQSKKLQQLSTGIPILNQTEINKSGVTPENYISVPDYDELSTGQITNNTYTTQSNGTYMDVLFNAVRQLQTEVTKLRNSFTMGINSYTEEDTTIASQVTDDTQEPLWAMDEDALQILESITIGEQNNIAPISNVDTSIDGKLTIVNTGTYEYLSTEEESSQKHYLYITSSKKSIQIILHSTTGDSNIVLNLNDIQTSYSAYYNIAIIFSRTKDTGGKNYIYMIISDKNTVLSEGYYNINTAQLQQDEYLLSRGYYIQSISFTSLELYKCNLYSKDFDFSYGIVPSAPSEDDEKYRAAHITIRSIKKLTTAQSIVKQLLNNELIYIEDQKGLYIVNNNTLVSLATGGSTNTDTGMTEAEIIALLQDKGIVTNDNGNLEISNLADLTFIHQESGKKFKFYVDESGELISQEQSDSSLSNDVNTYNIDTNTSLDNIRGFISRLLIAKNTTSVNPIVATNDVGLYSDRLKIGAFYAPLATDTAYGCSHAYIELENTSGTDINLQGCKLLYSTIINSNPKVLSLDLTGIIKAGSTYLIRGKQYTKYDDANCFIRVETYDQEWYYNKGTETNPEYGLVDLSTPKTEGRALMLVYGTDANITYNTSPWTTNSDTETSSNFPFKFAGYFIDSLIYVGAKNVISTNIGITSGDSGSQQTTYYWAPGGGDNYKASPIVLASNSLVKNTFELDPAKQAFQSFNKVDSSRNKWATATDVQTVSLAKEYIEFPKTDEVFPVSNYTPKSSKENKNVCTDKTQLDKDKPNMVTCSFGINMFTTRTFNWISCGLFDEYVWIVKGNYLGKDYSQIVNIDTATVARFESYKSGTENDSIGSSSGMTKKSFTKYKDIIYNRITSYFPGCKDTFTSHKCIVNIVSTPVTEATTYSYIVGRADKNGAPDINHCSKVQTFTLYPTTAVPVIVQTTDQQGFHWIEYQVWNACAKKLEEEINTISTLGNMPILVNTGDMTQNGTRINEWLDYYNAGYNLFNHLEQVNCVGNNDLCGTVPTELGTGDDDGKSNSYYFHLFYCYEINEDIAPVYTGSDGITRYIPSMYYLTAPVNDNKDYMDYTLFMLNSEITEVTCKNWFKANTDTQTINIYTGYTLGSNASECNYQASDNKYIYEQLYSLFNTYKNTKIVVACHEMPFTVITNKSLKPASKTYTRAYNGSDTSAGVIGSHMNQISFKDYKGTYWFSRLLSAFGIKLCIGGHKHTYSCTYPIKENWTGTMGSTLNSSDDFDLSATVDEVNITKKPLVKISSVAADTSSVIYPGVASPNMTGGVVYFMCQATGYKLTSNKELPSANQIFSQLVPKTTINTSTKKDEASSDQKYPMYAVINMDKYSVQLIRMANIMTSAAKFSQDTYGTGDIVLQYATVGSDIYGAWTTTKSTLINGL